MKVSLMYFHGGFAQIPEDNAIFQTQQSIAKESSAALVWSEVFDSFIEYISEET